MPILNAILDVLNFNAFSFFKSDAPVIALPTMASLTWLCFFFSLSVFICNFDCSDSLYN